MPPLYIKRERERTIFHTVYVFYYYDYCETKFLARIENRRFANSIYLLLRTVDSLSTVDINIPLCVGYLVDYVSACLIVCLLHARTGAERRKWTTLGYVFPWLSGFVGLSQYTARISQGRRTRRNSQTSFFFLNLTKWGGKKRRAYTFWSIREKRESLTEWKSFNCNWWMLKVVCVYCKGLYNLQRDENYSVALPTRRRKQKWSRVNPPNLSRVCCCWFEIGICRSLDWPIL